jgi:SAM-dependent methyltransferase
VSQSKPIPAGVSAPLLKRWKSMSWEEMAQENPMLAVMTTDDMADAPPTDFSPELLEVFFRKGRRLFRRRIAGMLAHSPDPKEQSFVVEYGCGMGRLLKPLAEAGYRCAGIDISPTMLEHCRELVPEVEALYGLDEAGRSQMPDNCASVVYSYAVVQHIDSLSRYLAAFDEMCRVLKPGGLLAVQLNCKDFEHGDFNTPGRTENHEAFSLHWGPGEAGEPLRHDQSHWSGVYIGHDRITRHLKRRKLKPEAWSFHNPEKLLSLWLVARKRKRP